MYKSLKNGDMLALASDQNAKQSGTYINFFGKPARCKVSGYCFK